jgi:hypothetical protein
VWTFQTGTQTLTDFRQLAAVLSPDAAQRDPREVGKGIYASGVNVQAFVRFYTEPDTVVQFISVRLLPSVAQADNINISNFTPAAMIQALGNPDEAYLLFSKQNINRTNRYRLILVYADRSAAYVINGRFREGKACLTPEDAETLTLYRFAGEAGMTDYLPRILTSRVSIPPTIRETTNQTPSDFVRMAQNPTTDCLTLK